MFEMLNAGLVQVDGGKPQVLQSWLRFLSALGILTALQLGPSPLLSLGLTRHGEASGLLLRRLPCVQGLRSGRVP